MAKRKRNCNGRLALCKWRQRKKKNTRPPLCNGDSKKKFRVAASRYGMVKEKNKQESRLAQQRKIALCGNKT